jgi:hypothetical protein
MNRKDFIKTGLLSAGAVATASAFAYQSGKPSVPEKEIVGFNHLPNQKKYHHEKRYHPQGPDKRACQSWLA